MIRTRATACGGAAGAGLAGAGAGGGGIGLRVVLTSKGAAVVRTGATCTGIQTVKVEPLPDSLAAVTSPPMRRANWREMARPSPVPPNFAVVDASACEKVWKRRPICSVVMPMPLSLTLMMMHSPGPITPRLTARLTWPLVVNLEALLSKLSRIWRNLVVSACMTPICSLQSMVRRFCFFSISGATVVVASRTRVPTSKVSRKRSIRPASILDRSSTSLMRPSRWRAALRILPRSSMALWLALSVASSSRISE